MKIETSITTSMLNFKDRPYNLLLLTVVLVLISSSFAFEQTIDIHLHAGRELLQESAVGGKLRLEQERHLQDARALRKALANAHLFGKRVRRNVRGRRHALVRVTTEAMGWDADGWPNGVVGTPDGKKLYVNKWAPDINTAGTWVFDINPNGTLSNMRKFVDMHVVARLRRAFTVKTQRRRGFLDLIGIEHVINK